MNYMGGPVCPRLPLSPLLCACVVVLLFFFGLPRAYSTKRKKRRYPLASVRDPRLERRVLVLHPGLPGSHGSRCLTVRFHFPLPFDSTSPSP